MSASKNNENNFSDSLKRKKGRQKIVGHVDYYRSFFSENLQNKRDILVWLPPTYDNDRVTKYPVLYMHDGQNIMDPKTSSIGDDWRVDETATRLIISGRLKEIIIVGINCTDNRLEEYSDSETGRNYVKFLLEEVKPFIDKNYRTLPDAENAALMGSSMGGLISFLIVWNHPDVFSKAACLSNSFHYEDQKAIKMVRDYSGEKKNIRLYLDHGEDGLEEGQLMFAELTMKGYMLGQELDYFYDRGAEHNESAWADRLARPLTFLFGKDIPAANDNNE
jgi:predicted alpha/beta superfamily hydrolase